MDIRKFVEKVKSNPLEDLSYKIPYNLYDKWHEKPWICFEEISSLLNHKKIGINAQYKFCNVLKNLSRTAVSKQKLAPVDLNLEYLHAMLRKHHLSIENGEINSIILRDIEKGINDNLYIKEIVQCGVNVLSYCGNSESIKVLLLFVKPNVSKLESIESWNSGPNATGNRITEFALKSLRKIISKGSELHHKPTKGLKISISQEDREIVLQTMINGHLKQQITGLKCKCGKSYSELEYSDEDVVSEEEYVCDVCKDLKFACECYFCEVCKIQFCNICVNDSITSENHFIALEIMRFLSDENVIPHILPYIDSVDDNQAVIVLKTLKDHNYPRLNEYLLEIINTKEDQSYLVNSAIRILGENGNEEHVEILIEKLRIYSRGRDNNSLTSRNAVEKALANLHKYSNDYLFKILYSEHNLPKGFENSVKRTRNKIKDYKKPRTDNNWYSDLIEWRQKEFENSDFAYSNNILTHAQLHSIYKRQPETYEELMDYEIGASKVNKYGQEILNLVIKNLPDFGKSQKEIGPWRLPIEIEKILELELPSINLKDMEDMNSGFLINVGDNSLTKIGIKKITREKYLNEDKDILWKVLDYVIEDMIIRGSITKVGKGRGTRYVVISR